jgi:uncharacterized tellurite resistance protein B-like protein
MTADEIAELIAEVVTAETGRQKQEIATLREQCETLYGLLSDRLDEIEATLAKVEAQ